MRAYLWACAIVAGMLIGEGGCTPTPKVGSALEHSRQGGSLTSADMLFAPPSPEEIPGDQRGEQIRLGYKIVVDTQEYGRPYVGNRLNCTNCHLDRGRTPGAAPWVGLWGSFPEYRARSGRAILLEDRINDCFRQQRFPEPVYASDLTVALSMYMASTANGSTVNTPGIKR